MKCLLFFCLVQISCWQQNVGLHHWQSRTISWLHDSGASIAYCIIRNKNKNTGKTLFRTIGKNSTFEWRLMGTYLCQRFTGKFIKTKYIGSTEICDALKLWHVLTPLQLLWIMKKEKFIPILQQKYHIQIWFNIWRADVIWL